MGWVWHWALGFSYSWKNPTAKES